MAALNIDLPTALCGEIMRVKVPLAFLLVDTVLLQEEEEGREEEDEEDDEAASVAAAFRTLLVNMEVMRSWPLDKSVVFFAFLPNNDFSAELEEGITAGSVRRGKERIG